MTRVQVRSLLGTPMVADPFVNTRWDYMYYFKRGRWSAAQKRHFIVFFDATDKVERIDRPTDTVPTLVEAASEDGRRPSCGEARRTRRKVSYLRR